MSQTNLSKGPSKFSDFVSMRSGDESKLKDGEEKQSEPNKTNEEIAPIKEIPDVEKNSGQEDEIFEQEKVD